MKGTWREGSLAGDPEVYVGKALETAVSFHRGHVWENRGRVHLLGTLIDVFSLKRLRGGVLREGGLLKWRP